VLVAVGISVVLLLTGRYFADVTVAELEPKDLAF